MDMKFLGVVLVVSNAVVLVGVLALIWTMLNIPRKTTSDEICLPDGSSKLRCGKTVERLLEYTQSQIEVELNNLMTDYKELAVKNTDADGRCLNKKPVARLVMGDGHNANDDEKQKTNGMVPITTWKTANKLLDHGGFLRFGMVYNDGRVMVPVNGTYSISSSIVISLKPGSKGMHFRHALYKFNLKENKETELVSNLKPKLNNKIEQISFLTTIAKLISGEVVLVKVSDNVDFPKHEQNYLAVYLI